METTEQKQAPEAQGKAVDVTDAERTEQHSAHFNATWNVYLDLWTDYLQHQIKESQCRNPTDNSRTI